MSDLKVIFKLQFLTHKKKAKKEENLLRISMSTFSVSITTPLD